MHSKKGGGTLRYRVLSGVAALVGICLIGSGLSLYRLQQFNRSLDEMRKVTLPLERILSQLRRDGRAYSRETEKRLGRMHWQDSSWMPRPNPIWQKEAIRSELAQAETLLRDPVHVKWLVWVRDLQASFSQMEHAHEQLLSHLRVRDASAVKSWQDWAALRTQWDDSLENGWLDFERVQNDRLRLTESRVQDLKAGLQLILITVLGLSGLLVWLANRALAPLVALTEWVRQVSGRSIQKSDKDLIPHLDIRRDDEIASLAREFHRLSTSLMERERTVGDQHKRLEEQNQRLKDMGALNSDVLNSIQSALFVFNDQQQVTQLNPAGMRLIGVINESQVLGSKLSEIAGLGPWLIQESTQSTSPQPVQWLGRTYRHRWHALKGTVLQESAGQILLIDDVTEEQKLQERLTQMEGLAAMGKMSAQVAHEVRNPLHSIGLEAELALELTQEGRLVDVKQSLIAIQHSVDRLEKITDNYLKLSRLSSGKQERFLLSDLVQGVLATYAETLSKEGIDVTWKGSVAWGYGDIALLEQAFGNLVRNAIQALKDLPKKEISIQWGQGQTPKTAWIKISDNGPGIDSQMRKRLFEPFVTNKAQGTGLGLSFALRVFREQGGDLRLLENSHLAGACFEVILENILENTFENSQGKENANVETNLDC